MNAKACKTGCRGADERCDIQTNTAAAAGGYSLRRRLWGGCAVFALLMMVIAAIAVTADRTGGADGLAHQPDLAGRKGGKTLFGGGITTPEPGAGLKRAVILMSGLTVVFLIWLLSFFKKAVFNPLNEMIRAVRSVMERQLADKIRPPKNREFAEMSEVIGDLTADLQEILLCVRTATAQIVPQLNAAKRELSEKTAGESDPTAVGRIDRIKEKLEHLNGLIEGFRLFDVHISDGRIFQVRRSHGGQDGKYGLRKDGIQE